MNTRLRCSFCREYYDRDAAGTTKVGLAGVCSTGCLENLRDKARSKRIRRAVHRANKHKYGRRLPGQTRDKIRDRDGTACRFCGLSEGVEVHHIRYRSQGGPDTVVNLISLCRDHHLLVHSSKRHWQPILQMVQWLYYVEGMFLTVPEVEQVFGSLLEPEALALDEPEAME